MNARKNKSEAKRTESRMPGLTYALVVEQVRKGHEAKESAATTTAVSLSVATTFLAQNGKPLEEEADPGFFQALKQKLANPNSQDSPIIFAEKVDSSYLARIGALDSAHEALTGKLFLELLKEYFDKSDLTKKEIANQSGISKGILQLLRRGEYYDALQDGKIQRLDQVLGAEGKLAAAYMAKLTHKRAANILPLLAGQEQFGPALRAARHRHGSTLKDVAESCGASIVQLSDWELGKGIS